MKSNRKSSNSSANWLDDFAVDPVGWVCMSYLGGNISFPGSAWERPARQALPGEAEPGEQGVARQSLATRKSPAVGFDGGSADRRET